MHNAVGLTHVVERDKNPLINKSVAGEHVWKVKNVLL